MPPKFKRPEAAPPEVNRPAAKAPNFQRLIPLGVLVLLVTTALLFWARDLIREVFVLPLSYIFYFLRLFVRTTPQIFFWFSLLALLVISAWRVLVRPKVLMDVPVGMRESDWIGAGVAGRAAYWSEKVALLRSGQSGGYYQRSFQAALGRLLVEVLAYRYRLVPNQVEDALRDGALDVPPEIRDYALSALRREEVSRQTAWIEWWESTFGGLWNKLINRLRAWLGAAGFSGPAAAQKPGLPIDPRVARVLAYLKDELEVPNDDSGR